MDDLDKVKVTINEDGTARITMPVQCLEEMSEMLSDGEHDRTDDIFNFIGTIVETYQEAK